MPKLILLTSNHLRHRYIAHCLAEAHDLSGIISEAKAIHVERPVLEKTDLEAINSKHFADRLASEKSWFGSFDHFPEATSLLEISSGESNSAECQYWIEQLNPDYIVLFGSSIIKPPLLNAYRNKIINLHLGLSPYYRGAATNFFPLYYNQPECVGATIHLAIAQVDAGAILYQLRPDLEGGESLHDIGNKVIQKAGLILPRVISLYHGGKLQPQNQKPTIGQVFKNKDYSPRMVATIEANLERGLLMEYLLSRDTRNAQFPIIMPEI
jgi:methionyl-tRNA formyltransferase